METLKTTDEREGRWEAAPGDIRYWLIAERRYGTKPALLPLLTGGGDVLPVFSSEEEAATFLIDRGLAGGGWLIEEAETAGLFAMLCGPPCAGVKTVALDPMPELADGASARLVGVNVHRFAGRLSWSLTGEVL